MKRIGIGFTAIIAILAMSFTFASKSHNVVAKDALSNGCFTQVKVITNVNPITFTPAFVYTSNTILIYATNLNFPVALKNGVVSQEGEQVADPSTDCPWSDVHPICCYNVLQQPTSPVTYKVVSIRFGQLVP